MEETRQSSNSEITAEQTEIQTEIKLFLNKSFQRGILLEAMIVRVLLKDINSDDVFECGVAKAAHLSEHGDVQSLISVLTQWSRRLHRKRGMRQSSTEGERINTQLLKRFDQSLYNCYDEVRCMFPDMKTTSLSFHSDANYVHKTMAEIMTTVWPQRLCVYDGYKDFGYVEISSTSSIAIGKRSCFRLVNRLPKFAMYLDNISDNLPPEEAHIWVAVDDCLATVILEKFFNTTRAEIIEKHQLRTVTLENIGFELGSMAMNDNLGDRLSLIAGKTVNAIYDSDFKRLVIAYTGQSPYLSRDSLDKELESLRTKLATEQLELPFPGLRSPIRLQIGEGFKCFGVAGFLRSPDEKLSTMCSSECANISAISHVTERMILREEEINGNENDRKILFLTPEAVTHRNSCSALNRGVHNINDVVLNLIYQAGARNASKESDFEDVSHCNITRSAIKAVIKYLASEFQADIRQANDLIVGTEIVEGNRVRLGISFPNLPYAKAGLTRLKTCQSVSLENADQLDQRLKTFCVFLKTDLYQFFEEQIRFRLEQFKLEKTADNYDISSITGNYLETRIQVEFSETNHFNKINDYFTALLEPVRIKLKSSNDAFHLKDQAGKKFLQFLKEFTETHIRISNHQQILYIYGIGAKRNRAAGILRKQIANHPSDFRWYLINLGNMESLSNSVKMWYDEFWAKTVALQKNKVIRRCLLLKDRPELWLEATPESFELYYDSVKSWLTGGVKNKTFPLEITSEKVMCSVCFDQFAVTDERCYILSICGHAYCTECLLQMVCTAANEGRLPVKCAHENCGKSLAAQEFRSIASLQNYEDRRRLVRCLLESFVAKHVTSLRMCPDRSCQGMGLYEESSQALSCLWCRPMEWCCQYCGLKPHPGEVCGASFNISEWTARNPVKRKNCPKCTAVIMKDGGCNRMHCAYCHSIFFWN